KNEVLFTYKSSKLIFVEMNLDYLTREELRKVCKDKELRKYSKMKKGEMIDALTERFADMSFVTEEYIDGLKKARINMIMNAMKKHKENGPKKIKGINNKLCERVYPHTYKDELKKMMADGDVELEAIYDLIKDALVDFITLDDNDLEFDDYKPYVDSKDVIALVLAYAKG